MNFFITIIFIIIVIVITIVIIIVIIIIIIINNNLIIIIITIPIIIIIRELEGIIRSLQDSITKRHPDSISNLIRAASESESVQLKRRLQDEQIEMLKKELGRYVSIIIVLIQ
jgi:hypothetical protein